MNCNQLEKKSKFLCYFATLTIDPLETEKLVLFREAQKAGPGDQVRATSRLELIGVQMVLSADPGEVLQLSSNFKEANRTGVSIS